MDEDLSLQDAPAARLWRTFVDPAVDYRPVIFWIWSGELDPDRLRHQIDDMAAHGFGGFSVLPMDEHFRLQDFLRGMSVPYLSDEFFHLFRDCVTHAASLGLRVWLYDEGGWPSGSAQGRVVAGHPEFRARCLTCRPATPADLGVAAKPPSGLVGVVGISEDGTLLPLAPGSSAPPEARHLLAFEDQVADLQYPDLMNPAAVARFLELTHDRYAEAVGDFFGTVIPGMFTDECRLNGFFGADRAPWSPALVDSLQASSADWQAWLPALFSSDTLGFDPFQLLGEQAVVSARTAWGDVVSRQYQAAYFEQINRWCEAHNLLHTGHVGGEDDLTEHAANFFHFFRTAGALHAPGVDVIWRQVFPDRQNFSFPNLASSAMNLRPEGSAPPKDPTRQAIVPTESLAVYGYGADFAQFAYVAGFQFVRGVNRFWPIGYYYDVSDGLVYGTMSHLGPGNPLYRHWTAFNAFLARASAAVAASGHAADVAVYYPIEALWSYRGRPEAERAWFSCRDFCESLQSEQMPFDFIDADTLAAANTSEGYLETLGQDYSTVIVPDCRALPLPVLEKLVALHDSGGRVVFLGDEVPALPTSLADREAYEALRRRLADLAFTLDAISEREQWATAQGPGLEGMPGSVFDGMTSALLGPRPLEVVAPAAARRDAVVLAPEREWRRLAHLLAVMVGRCGLSPEEPTADLRISSRWLNEGTWVHLVFNEADDDLHVTLEYISERQSVLEQWDPLSGQRRVLALHSEVSEPTRFALDLGPANLTIVVAYPCPEEDFPPLPAGREFTLYVCGEPTEVAVLEQCFLEHGTLLTETDAGLLKPLTAGPWTDFDLDAFAGTLRYSFSLVVGEDYLDEHLFLDLGELEVAASAYLNGCYVGDALWPPYRLPVSGCIRPGHNELVLEVSNTLAAQILRPDNIDEAAARGWQNPYYRRTLEWHREAPGGALLGPVKLVAVLRSASNA